MQLMVPFSVLRKPVRGLLQGFPGGLPQGFPGDLVRPAQPVYHPTLPSVCGSPLPSDQHGPRVHPALVDPPPASYDVISELLVRCLLLTNSSGPFSYGEEPETKG